MTTADDILHFWFEEIEPKQHWIKDVEFDAYMVERFSDIHIAARHCELFPWRVNANGRLAEILILDQFSRNMYRDTAKAFAHDALALALAQEAVALNMHQTLEDSRQSFLLMPYMHSESKVVHQAAEKLFKTLPNYEFELKHKAIIDRFGRYPHRNALLGRVSTQDEINFLQQPGSSF